MKAKDITVGGTYRAKVNGRLVTVRVERIREGQTYGRSGRSYHLYDVINLETNRRTTFRSPSKFRGLTGAHPEPRREANHAEGSGGNGGEA